MELRRISWNTYDLFTGNGWNNVSRIRQSRTGVYVMAGERLPKPLLKELNELLFNWFPITPGMSLEQTVHNLRNISWRY